MSNTTSDLARLISAFHILHRHNIVHEVGGLSIRNPTNPSTFFMLEQPAILVSSWSDLTEWNIEDNSPHKSDIAKRDAADPTTSQRFIHSSIYARYDGVHSILHGSSQDTIMYGLCDAGGSMLRPVSSMAGFINHFNPIFDPANHYSKLQTRSSHNLLINTKYLGEALADALDGVKIVNKEGQRIPHYTIALLRGQGAVYWGENLKKVVFKAIMVERNAKIQTKAMLQRADTELELTYLNDTESVDCSELVTDDLLERSWQAWVAEVERCGLYRNELSGQG